MGCHIMTQHVFYTEFTRRKKGFIHGASSSGKMKLFLFTLTPLSGVSTLKGKLLSIDIITQDHLGSEMKFSFSWFPLTACLFYPSDLMRMSGMRYHPVMPQTQYAACVKGSARQFEVQSLLHFRSTWYCKHDCEGNCEKKSGSNPAMGWWLRNRTTPLRAFGMSCQEGVLDEQGKKVRWLLLHDLRSWFG